MLVLVACGVACHACIGNSEGLQFWWCCLSCIWQLRRLSKLQCVSEEYMNREKEWKKRNKNRKMQPLPVKNQVKNHHWLTRTRAWERYREGGRLGHIIMWGAGGGRSCGMPWLGEKENWHTSTAALPCHTITSIHGAHEQTTIHIRMRMRANIHNSGKRW